MVRYRCGTRVDGENRPPLAGMIMLDRFPNLVPSMGHFTKDLLGNFSQAPKFLVDPQHNLFYCYGCGRGGDIIRFAELYYRVKFPHALTLLLKWRGITPPLDEAARFYRSQLPLSCAALNYLRQRGVHSHELVEHMRIGYAPGGCLRRKLTELGHSLSELRDSGLVTASGCDTFADRIVFPLEGNLYGRSVAPSPIPHRFLPGSKGGLYNWCQARSCPTVILVEGLFDYAALWQAGFHNVTCSLGTHLNALQFRQLCDAPRTVYLAFDSDRNGSGRQAASHISQTLRQSGIHTHLVWLPEDHDPNSFFTSGSGDARQFHALLESATQ